jgi:hypothetical protein
MSPEFDQDRVEMSAGALRKIKQDRDDFVNLVRRAVRSVDEEKYAAVLITPSVYHEMLRRLDELDSKN